jgi:xylitol oxidase
MNKRTFVKLFAVAIAYPEVMRRLAWAGQERLRNWAGKIEYSTNRLQTSTSLDQVRDYVKTQNKMKVLGTRHCFNNIADSKDAFLSLKPMDNVIAIDPAKRTVTVAAVSRMDSCAHISTARGLRFTISPRYPISPSRVHAVRQPTAPVRKTGTWRRPRPGWK